ncbi:MAG: asparagine synthase (glutamine-hydrolyzing) [Candidatus Palauibacterales bacterium]|nr:asparagine synthase (glutamine-hydrolyzing) [Candidatus Palauibacterales bacterium]MDP2530576.1 asparagine synthase (glutamine-hydrolyzing) [Candidatus Palauibacterales bacterium]MDP2583625.1 asparagine synthase (glutamine-hydrolyzing) [Candidatus Palauibacterales bacterium]
MCGFVVFLGEAAPDTVARLDEATASLTHRGPDDSGKYRDERVLMGHRRLSILDLSGSAAQPMVDAASGAVLVYNGEIYNYRELRAELEGLGHRFRSDGDSEVLLQAFLRWGPDACRRFNGMWAFAVWLPGRRRLFVARGRFGIKPLYYAFTRGGVLLASEPKAILAMVPSLRDPDLGVLGAYLAGGRAHFGGRTYYRGIRSFPAAHHAWLKPGDRRLVVTRYWDYPDFDGGGSSIEGSIEEFGGLLDSAVGLRLRSDVEVGYLVSGGADSSAILASVAKRREPVGHCFTSTYGDEGRGEAAWAGRATRAVGEPLIEAPSLREGWLETLSKVSWHLDCPTDHTHAFPRWALLRTVAEAGVTVVLEGQGADEELAGYAGYAGRLLAELLRGLPGGGARSCRARLALGAPVVRAGVMGFGWRVLASRVLRSLLPDVNPPYRRRRGVEGILDPVLRRALRETAPDAGDPARGFGSGGMAWSVPRRVGTGPRGAASGSRADAAVHALLRRDHAAGSLPSLLQLGDAVSMAHSVESRLPFLDHRLVEWCFRLPPTLLYRNGETKWPVRGYLRRGPLAPLADRPRKGAFPTPLLRWIADEGGRDVEDLVTGRGARITEYCDRGGILELFAMARRGEPTVSHHLFRLVFAELWLRSCVTA